MGRSRYEDEVQRGAAGERRRGTVAGDAPRAGLVGLPAVARRHADGGASSGRSAGRVPPKGQ